MHLLPITPDLLNQLSSNQHSQMMLWCWVKTYAEKNISVKTRVVIEYVE